MTYIKIADGVFGREASPDPAEIIYLADLKTELAEIDAQLENIEKEPNEILVPNDSKFYQMETLKGRKEIINKLLELEAQV